MKKISAFLLSAFLILSISVGAMAAGPVINSVTMDGGRVSVTGTNTSGKPMTIEVLQDGKTWEEIETAEDINILEYLYYFNQTDSFGANGSFEFAIDDWAGTDEPEMRIYSGGEYFYHSPTQLRMINAATDVTDFESKVKEHLFLAGEMEKIEAQLNEDEKNEFWNKLFAYKGVVGGFKNFGEIVSAAPELSILVQIELSTTSTIKGLLSDLGSYGIKNSDSWDIFTNKNEFAKEDYLTSDQESALYSCLKQKADGCYKAADFIKYFNDAVVLTACHNRGSSYLVRNIIEKSDILAAAETGDFSSLTAEKKLEVAEKIDESETPFATISALAKEIADLSEENSDEEPESNITIPSDKNNNNSGGGGGGGGGKSYAVDSTPKEETAPNKKQFSDIAAYTWAEDAIYALQEKGIVQGTGKDIFEPARAVTREEFVKMLVLSANIYDENAKAQFTDTAQGAWYVPYVASAYNAKLINGMTEDVFGIGRVITREQLAVMIYRALDSRGKLQNVNITENFSDIDAVSAFATDAVNYVKAAGLMNGMGDGSFAPHENVNRAQAAKVIYELLQRL